MPLQNRVDPFGDLHSVSERGTVFGNRGLLHDDNRAIVRAWAHQNWISCVLSYKDFRHDVMAVPARTYTGLFFRDEATALAAGARPCFLCRREDATAFVEAIGERLSAPELDKRLHAERVSAVRHGSLAARRRLHPVSDLPPGVIVVDEGEAFVVTGHGLRRWSFGELGPAADVSAKVLTPPTSVAALNAGYLPTSVPLIAGE